MSKKEDPKLFGSKIEGELEAQPEKKTEDAKAQDPEKAPEKTASDKPLAALISEERKAELRAKAEKALEESNIKGTESIPAEAPKASESLLSEERKAELRAKAEKIVLAEKIKAAEDLFLFKELSRARGNLTAIVDAELEEIEYVDIFLPPLYENDMLIIDNVYYFNNMTYPVPRGKAMVMREMIYKAWAHEDIAIRGRDENKYRNKRNARVSVRTGQVINSTSSLRA